MLLDAVLSRLRTEFEASEKAALFDQLKPFLRCDQAGFYAEVASRIGLTEGALKVAVHRFKRR